MNKHTSVIAGERTQSSMNKDHTQPCNTQAPLPGSRQVLFVMNRHANTAAIFQASCFEELQAMFRVGIGLPDGTLVNSIGRCRSIADFQRKAQQGGTRVQSYV